MNTNDETQSNGTNMVLIAIGDKVIIDGKATGTVTAVTYSCYQVHVDGYDYSDNKAYEYHNILKNRCAKANCN